MSHAELEDMFGRRPRPLVLPEIVLHRSGETRHLLFRLQNVGLGTARWATLGLTVVSQEPSYTVMVPTAFLKGFSQEDVRSIEGGRSAVYVPSAEVHSHMHPGMGYEYCRATIMAKDRQRVPPEFSYIWTTMAENMRMHQGEVVLTRDRVLGDGEGYEVIARWAPHPDWGEPLFTIPLADNH
jgi:hypothetical protein